MLRLTLLLHSIAASVISGIGIVFVLVAGWVNGPAIVSAFVVGLILGWPAARIVARRILGEHG